MVAGHRGVAKSAATKAISAWHFQVGCQLPLYGAWEAIPIPVRRKFRMLKASK
jgi:hypothetical protein